MDKQNLDRSYNLKEGAYPKQKNKKSRKIDRAFISARNKHKKRKYNQNEVENDKLYFEMCIVLMRISRKN